MMRRNQLPRSLADARAQAATAEQQIRDMAHQAKINGVRSSRHSAPPPRKAEVGTLGSAVRIFPELAHSFGRMVVIPTPQAPKIVKRRGSQMAPLLVIRSRRQIGHRETASGRCNEHARHHPICIGSLEIRWTFD
jgi:hypothetical protein